MRRTNRHYMSECKIWSVKYSPTSGGDEVVFLDIFSVKEDIESQAIYLTR